MAGAGEREPGDLLRICIKDGRIDVLRSILSELGEL